MAAVLALMLLATLFTVVAPLAQQASANHGVCDLNITPENDTNPTGTTHTLTATLVEDSPNAEGAGVCNDPRAQATNVDFEIDCVSGGTATAYTGETGGTAENPSGAECTQNDPAGTPDDVRTTPDLSCVIPANSGGSGDAAANSCTVSYTRDTDGQDEIVGWVDEDLNDTTDNSDTGEAFADNDSDSTDAVAKFWSDPSQQQIDCTPEGDVNPTGTQHTVTCTVRSAAGANPNLEGADVDYQVTGANPTGPQHGCTTNANGTCSFTYTGNNAGGDVIQAWVNQDGNHTNNDCGAEATADDPPAFTGGTDFCDQVEKTWQARGAALLNVEPETDTNPNGTQHTLTATVRDQFGQAVGAGTPVDFEIVSGPNQGQVDQTAAGGADMTCTTDANGQCQVTYTDAAAFDANNATDTICGWIDANNNDAFNTGGGSNDGGDCDTETANETEEGNDPNNAPIGGAGEGNDDTDTVLKTWTAPVQQPATQIDAEPEDDTNPAANGAQHIIQVSALTAGNQPTTASTIRADVVSGPDASGIAGQAEINCTADNTPPPGSTVQFTAPHQQTHECVLTNNGTPGTDVVRVFIDADNDGVLDANETFDEVRKIWSGAAFGLTLTPDSDAATAGVCNEFTVTVVDVGGRPVVGQNVDVLQSLQSPAAGNDPQENRELYFCDPTAGGTVQTGQNPATQQTVGNVAPGAPGAGAGTRFGDVQGNQQVGGAPGNNTAVHAEVGPTNNNGQVTFGIGIRCGNNNADVSCITQATTVSVRAWVDSGGDNDTFDAGEPSDNPSTKTWNPGGQGAVTGLNAEPENASNPINTQHQVTVTITGAGGPIQGVTPNSIIAANAAGRPQGDVTNPNAGASPNANAPAQGAGPQNIYSCTPSNAQGVSTCTFTDPNNTPAGTDTIVFYVNQAGGGTPGPDANEPFDAVQKTWTPGPQNLDLDVQCGGRGTADDQDVVERTELVNQNQTPDCTNPLSDADEVFTAIVTNPAQGNVGVAGIRVDFSFGFTANGGTNTTNDATLTATPGGQIGRTPPGLLTFCTTDATGRCTVTLNNATPQAGDVIEVVGAISGATGGNPNDTATKGWQSSAVNQVGTITLTPRAATNQVGTQHTITATVRDQFGQPVQGANVDWSILAGSPNANVAPETDDVTDANGNATFTYTSNVTGTDTIRACTETGGSENDTCDPGEPSGQANKTWQTGPVTTSGVALDMDADDNNVGGANATGNPGACDLSTSGADPARESTATNQINPNPGGALDVNNFHRICAAAFQANQVGNQGRLAGAVITFTIQGPGRIFAANANGNCALNAVPPAGTTVTVTADNNGYAFACLYSQQVGRTTVTASSGNPAQTATGTKDWTVSPNTARFIQLCHGDVAGTTCVTDQQTNEPNDEHEMTARVTDAQGNPVANVLVQFRETGPGIFTPQGGSTASVTTDANGLAAVLLTSDVEGTSTIVAEIDPAQTGAGRGVGTDECERAAGTNNQPAAGNCVSQTLTKVWDEIPPPIPECDDGLDNDGDNLVDFGEDPGCIDDNDNSELPVNPDPEPDRFRHDRSISIRFNDGTGARNNGLVVFGRLRAPGFPDCRSGMPVNVQRRVNGRWVTKKTTNTNRRGRYAVEIFDLASRYRAVAPRVELEDIDNNRVDICRKAIKAKRHRHRR